MAMTETQEREAMIREGVAALCSEFQIGRAHV